MTRRYDRSAIMKMANRLAASGMPRAEAMKAAWQAAKAAPLSTYPTQQEAGLRASLKRYGIDPDKIALKTQEAVRKIVAAIADRPALLPPPTGMGNHVSIELQRHSDGVYRL